MFTTTQKAKHHSNITCTQHTHHTRHTRYTHDRHNPYLHGSFYNTFWLHKNYHISPCYAMQLEYWWQFLTCASYILWCDVLCCSKFMSINSTTTTYQISTKLAVFVRAIFFFFVFLSVCCCHFYDVQIKFSLVSISTCTCTNTHTHINRIFMWNWE